MNKSSNLIIRISDKDKQDLKELAEARQMSMSELVVFLIRREVENTKNAK